MDSERPDMEVVAPDTELLTEKEAEAAGLTPDQRQFAMVPYAEAQMLTQIAMLLVEAGVMMSNPPRILSAETQRYNEQIQAKVDAAGALAIQWAAAKGIVTLQVEQKPPLLSSNGNQIMPGANPNVRSG